ncbi:hypothetical protein KC318_g6689 [Hortaea werneckii]|nr:hypothetical protein KC334_g16020 [Hortaea werneckii]KAI6999821.1 hypothetical protein KC355_g10126 [Hortaea werneckii]KAI7666172.1 hypothetical protein KC318_g6689 [Hortaea werneckii]
MTYKRSSAELAGAPARPPSKELKRTRLSPSTQQRSNSSEPSSCSVSEDSAARSTPPTSTHEQNSSLSSPSSDDESDTASSLSTSSEESVHTIGGPRKPEMNGQTSTESARDLQSRLSAFLPQLAAANQQLQTDGGGHSFEDVEDGEQHIEMNLGLGVLEEKRDDGSSSSEESSDEDEVMQDGVDAPAPAGAEKQGPDSKDTHVLEKLKGEGRRDQKGGIQEIG